MLRSTRSRQARKPFTPSRPTVQRTVSYNVNKTKALNQKLEATNRDHLQIALKNGNLVLTFSTAAFEAFRGVLQTFSNTQPFKDINFEFETRSTKDGCARAEESFVAYKSGTKLYRINLYLTTSVVNANGGHLHTFYSDHLHFIVNELVKIGNFNDLNRVMKEKIAELLETVDTGDTNNTEKVSIVSRGPAAAAGNLSVDEMNSISDQPEICFVCEKYCTDNAVLCDRCNSWSHYECEKISESERQVLENSDNYYSCTSCRVLMAIDNVDRSETEDSNLPIHYNTITSCPSIAKILNSRELGITQLSKSKNKPVGTPKIIQSIPTQIKLTKKHIDVAINTDICYSDTKLLDQLSEKEKQLKVKERELANKEAAMKSKERTLNDTSKKLATAQSYIYTLEKKIEDLEWSLALNEQAVKMSKTNKDGDTQNSTESNTIREAKSFELRLNVLESKVGQLLSNNDKSIVINNNNNYGSSNCQEHSWEGMSKQVGKPVVTNIIDDTPVGDTQSSEVSPNSTKSVLHDTQSDRSVSVSICEQESKNGELDLPTITESNGEMANSNTKSNYTKPGFIFLEKTPKKKKPSRYRRKNQKRQQLVNGHQQHWQTQPLIQTPMGANLPVYHHGLIPPNRQYVTQHLQTAMLGQPLYPPSTLRTSQQMPCTYQRYLVR